MICYAAQYNQLKPDRGNSGAIPSCVTTLSGFFTGDTMKTCRICNETKPFSEFYKDITGKNGRSTICKICRSKQIKEYNKTERGRAVLRCIRKYFYIRHPERFKARDAIKYATQTNKIIRPNYCQECRIKCKLHGHHEDYYKPLDVIWLCQVCHKKLHFLRCKDEIQKKANNY